MVFTAGGAHSFVKTYICPSEDFRMYVILETIFRGSGFNIRSAETP